MAAVDPVGEEDHVPHVPVEKGAVPDEATQISARGQSDAHPVPLSCVVGAVGDGEGAVDEMHPRVLDPAGFHLDGLVDNNACGEAVAQGGREERRGGVDPPAGHAVGAPGGAEDAEAAAEMRAKQDDGLAADTSDSGVVDRDDLEGGAPPHVVHVGGGQDRVGRVTQERVVQ